MKYCQYHWDALRAAITARGLDHLIAANGREAMARALADLNGKGELADFDPLMAAHNLVWSRAMDVLGLGIMMQKPDGGDYCPVCELMRVTPPPPEGHRYATNEAYFTDGPADSVLAECHARGIDKPFVLPEAEK